MMFNRYKKIIGVWLASIVALGFGFGNRFDNVKFICKNIKIIRLNYYAL